MELSGGTLDEAPKHCSIRMILRLGSQDDFFGFVRDAHLSVINYTTNYIRIKHSFCSIFTSK